MAPVSNNPVRPNVAPPTNAAASTEAPPTPTTDWKGRLDTMIDQQKSANPSPLSILHLDDKTISKIKDDVSKHMQEFTSGKDGNDPQKIANELKTAYSKSAGHEMLGKMQMNYFMQSMQRRAKEIAADLYK